MSVPLIGITTSRGSGDEGAPAYAATQAYARAVAWAGGAPLLIPLELPDAAREALLERLDGLLFSGGGDVHPERYGSQMHPLVNSIDEQRDRVEIALLQGSAGRGLPFLGICRGLQVINVALGGSLYEDLLDQLPGALRHDCSPGHERDFLAHPVTVEAGTRLRSILGSAGVHVNSMHHQGIRLLAPGLVSSAHAPDGVIEAFELAGHPFGLAVQWHPEWLQSLTSMRTLFVELVTAARRHRPNG